ncbi:MAG TPA: YceI family protein [Haliangiales bacterium]|nr:YceI family protein [Haliangiales bacterium]
MARYRVVPDRSHLTAEARSSLHPIKVETNGLQGFVEADADGGGPRLGAPFTVEIAAERLKSGNFLTDTELQRRLETRKFPRIVGDVKGADPVGGSLRWRLSGNLSLHGVTRATDAEVTVRVVDDRTLEIEGEKVIDIRDYGMTPPKLLMLRVYPDVKVHARLVVVRVD